MDQQDSLLRWISLYNERNQHKKINQMILQLLSSAFPSLVQDVDSFSDPTLSCEWRKSIKLLEMFYERKSLYIDVARLPLCHLKEEMGQSKDFIRLIEYLLGALVQSEQKEMYVRDIMSMEDSIQVDLMAIIERVLNESPLAPNNQLSSQSPTLTTTENNQTDTSICSLTNDQNGNNSSFINEEEEEEEEEAEDDTYSPRYSTRQDEKDRIRRENKIIKEENIHLSKELNQIKENCIQMEKTKHEMEKEMENLKFQIEIESVKKERAIRSLFEERIQSLEQELNQKTTILHEKNLIANEVETLRDEVDLLRPAAEKVIKLENSLTKYKQKVDELGAIKEKCRRQEEINHQLMEKNLELETQVQKASSLQRKLDEAKETNTNLAFHVSELEATLSRKENEFVRTHQELELSQRQLQEQKALYEEYQNLPQQNDASLLDDVSTSNTSNAAGGISELNPEMVQKMARLEYENMELRKRIDGETSDKIDSLLDEVDDLRRLKKNVETKYFQKKDELKQIKEQLEQQFQKNQEKQTLCDMQSEEIDQKKIDLNEKNNKIQQLNDHLSLKQQENHVLQQANMVQNTQIQELIKNLSQQKELYTKLQEKWKILSNQFMCLQEDWHGLCQVKREFVHKSLVLTKEKDELNCLMQELQNQILFLQSSLAREQEKSSNLTEERDGLLDRAQKLDARIAFVTLQMNSKGMENEDLMQKYLILNSKNHVLLDEKNHLIREGQQLICLKNNLEQDLMELETLFHHIKCQLQDQREENTSLETSQKSLEENLKMQQEDFQMQLLMDHTKHITTVNQLTQMYEQDKSKMNFQIKELLCQHEQQIFKKEEEIFSKRNEIIEFQQIFHQRKEEYEVEIHKFQQKNDFLQCEREKNGLELEEYRGKHLFSNEMVHKYKKAFEKQIVTLQNKNKELIHCQQKKQKEFDQILQQLQVQKEQLNGALTLSEGQVENLKNLRDQMSQEIKMLKQHLMSKEITVTKLESKMLVFEKERSHWNTKKAQQQKYTTENVTIDHQLETQMKLLQEEMTRLQEENIFLQNQQQKIEQMYHHHQNTNENLVMKGYLERLHEMEDKKTQDDAKRRELLLVNAKLLQEQKQLLHRSSLQAKEMDRLQEKINSLLLREERRKLQEQLQQQSSPVKQEQEKTVYYCSPPRQTVSSPTQSVTNTTNSPEQEKEKKRGTESLIEKNGQAEVDDKENMTPRADENQKGNLTTEGSDNTTTCGLSGSTKRPFATIEEQQQANASNGVSRPTKRRISHFMTKTLQSNSTTTEKPSECKQQ